MTIQQEQAKERRDAVLLGLRANPDATSAEMGVPTSYAWELERDGWVRKSGVRRGKGRPANLYRLSERGRKRAAKRAKAEVLSESVG